MPIKINVKEKKNQKGPGTSSPFQAIQKPWCFRIKSSRSSWNSQKFLQGQVNLSFLSIAHPSPDASPRIPPIILDAQEFHQREGHQERLVGISQTVFQDFVRCQGKKKNQLKILQLTYGDTFEQVANLLGSHSAYFHIENSKKPYSKATSSILIDPEFYKLLSSQNLFFSPLNLLVYVS